MWKHEIIKFEGISKFVICQAFQGNDISSGSKQYLPEVFNGYM